MSCNDIITPSREDLRYLVDLIHVRKRKVNIMDCKELFWTVKNCFY